MPTAESFLLEMAAVPIRCKGIGKRPRLRSAASRANQLDTLFDLYKEPSMINAIAQLLKAASPSRIDAISRQVADLSSAGVCELVYDHVQSMTFSEARGYVRARASRVVRKQALSAVSRHPGADLTWVDDVSRAATERLIPVVLRQVGVGVPVAARQIRLAA